MQMQRLLLLPLSLAAGLLAAGPLGAWAVGQDPCSSSVPAENWQTAAVGTVQFRLPSEYAPLEVRSVDSAVDAWATRRGQRVDTDLGLHTRHFLGRRDGPIQRLIAICSSATDGAWPQIVLYWDYDERVAAGLWWPLPEQRMLADDDGRVRPTAFWMAASSSDSTDLPELLTIVRSVRVP
jgi:hypothetical protein